LPIPAGIQKVDVPLDNKETKQIWPIKFWYHSVNRKRQTSLHDRPPCAGL